MNKARFIQHGFTTLEELGFHSRQRSSYNLDLFLSKPPKEEVVRSYQSDGFATFRDWVLSFSLEVVTGNDGLKRVIQMAQN